MKIAITGHSAGIGQALAQVYESQGHEVLGLSRRTGYNIRSVPKVADAIEPCDMFVNNAQAGFAQTELLIEVARRWQGQPKTIIVISTMMTQSPVATIPGLDMLEYRVQKVALEEACRQLRYQLQGAPRIVLVKPGAVATQPGNTTPPYADVDYWAQTLVEILDSVKPDLRINEIALA